VKLTFEGVEVRFISCIVHMSSCKAYLAVVDAPVATRAEYNSFINKSYSLFLSACTRALCCLKTTLRDGCQSRFGDELVWREYAAALAVVL
jgi:hypothetical protein